MAARSTGHRNRNEPVFALETFEVEKAGPLAELLVGLLQGDHIGTDLADHRRGAFRVEALVAADAFVNIVRGDEQVGPRTHVPQGARSSPGPQGRENPV